MLIYKYTDTSIQKGEFPGFTNYFEHTRAMTQLLNEAMIKHKDLTVVWLDQANAYESILHQLIHVTMHQYYIPDLSSNLIMNYFNNIHISFSSNKFTNTPSKGYCHRQASSLSHCSPWFKHVYQGSKTRESRDTKANTEICLPSNRGFIDDMTVTTETDIQVRWILMASNKVGS